MNCNKVEKLLLEDATAGERSPMREHLAVCSPCRALYRELRSIEDLSLSLGGGKGAPQDFSSQILAQTVQRQPSRRLTAAAAVILLSLAGAANLWNYLAGEGANRTAKASDAVAVADESPLPAPVIRLHDMRQDPYVDVEFQSPSQGRYVVQIPARVQIQSAQPPDELSLTRISY